jgi:hypothetical protein
MAYPTSPLGRRVWWWHCLCVPTVQRCLTGWWGVSRGRVTLDRPTEMLILQLGGFRVGFFGLPMTTGFTGVWRARVLWQTEFTIGRSHA